MNRRPIGHQILGQRSSFVCAGAVSTYACTFVHDRTSPRPIKVVGIFTGRRALRPTRLLTVMGNSTEPNPRVRQSAERRPVLFRAQGRKSVVCHISAIRRVTS